MMLSLQASGAHLSLPVKKSIPRVADQNGMSQQYNMLEIYHSGPPQAK